MKNSEPIDLYSYVRNKNETSVSFDPTLHILHKLENGHAEVLPKLPVIDLPPLGASIKRWIDIIGALGLLTVSIPVILITIVLIKLTSPGPLLFKQKRVGRGGQIFTLYKFRSMVVDAEQKLGMLHHKNEVPGPVFKIKEDPRLTPVGKFIRKWSIDELPQLINVLKGEMSLVGPRPPIPSEVMQYKPQYFKRLAVKPGLTCIWQVSGRSHIPFEQWMELDAEYVDNWSIGLDIKLLLQTIPAVILGDGAH